MRLRDIDRKSPIVTYPTCIWHLVWSTTSKFCQGLWRQKTRVR